MIATGLTSVAVMWRWGLEEASCWDRVEVPQPISRMDGGVGGVEDAEGAGGRSADKASVREAEGDRIQSVGSEEFDS